MTAYEFNLRGTNVLFPTDHGYMLRSALSKPFPFLHGRHDIQIAPLRGTRTVPGMCKLDKGSTLHIRGLTPDEANLISEHGYFFLNGQQVWIEGCRERTLTPSTQLVSRLVLFRDHVDPEEFLKALTEKLPVGVLFSVGRSHAAVIKTNPIRRWKGYTVTLTNMTPEQSILIQQTGIGHGKSMGCGVFYPGTIG